MTLKNWCIEQHNKTNHMYSKYLPYKFHLEMVYNVFLEFKHLLNDTDEYFSLNTVGNNSDKITLKMACEIACWGHDLIEDCRISYNDCVNVLGREAAEIIYALTNEKGKNRNERANDKYYEGIRNTNGATFVKLCDRIANVQFGKLTKSGMFDKYNKENENFLSKVNADMYPEMKQYLIDLFK